jgi:dipeptidyl aminopeptidase/acylaminoacyl peptidase
MSNMGACVVVHGTRDDVVPIKDSIFMAEAVPGNKVKVVSVDDRHSLPKACKPAKLRSYIEDAMRWHGTVLKRRSSSSSSNSSSADGGDGQPGA